MPGKLKQRPTMPPSLPGGLRAGPARAASGGPCYFLCWLRGSWPAHMGRKQPGHLPPPPAGLAPQAGVAAPASRASPPGLFQACPAQSVLPGSARLSQEGKRDPVPLTAPSCRPHVLHHLRRGPVSAPEPLWPEHRAHRTEAQAGQGAVAGY